MDNLVNTLTDPNFLIAVFAAIAAAAVVFTFGASLLRRHQRSRSASSAWRSSARRCAPRKWRACAAAAPTPNGAAASRRAARSKDYMKNVVERFSLQKAFADENTVDKLATAGYRGQGPLTTFLFLRFVTPIALFFLGFGYLAFIDHRRTRRSGMNALYALGVGLVGAYLPILLLKNRTIKRQQSIRRAWPDCLDLLLLCVEAGMSIEHRLQARRQGDGRAEPGARRRADADHRRTRLPRGPHPRLRQSRQAHRPRRRQVGDDRADPGRPLRHLRRHRRCASWPRKAASSA